MIEEPKKVKPIRMKLIDGAEVPAEVLTKRGLTKKQLQQLEKVKQSSCIVFLIQNGMVSKNTYVTVCFGIPLCFRLTLLHLALVTKSGRTWQPSPAP